MQTQDHLDYLSISDQLHRTSSCKQGLMLLSISDRLHRTCSSEKGLMLLGIAGDSGDLTLYYGSPQGNLFSTKKKKLHFSDSTN